ncbi:MAG: carbohydrate kinase family protein [Candidatus Bathyarchaeia archaeon]
MQANWKNELLSFLQTEHKQLSVVVMPDFFLDRIISLNCGAERFYSMVNAVADRKGGSIDGIAQVDIRGGNAVNTATALAALGVTVTPIICTNKIGLQLLKSHLEPYCIDTSHVKLSAKASVTTALEFKTEGGTANVMLRDVGSLCDFGPSRLTVGDFEAIEQADYVCVFNWAGTKKYGTKLAQTVFSRVKARGRGKTYFDTADPTPNQAATTELLDKVLKSRQVDILSVNENEAVYYAEMLDEKIEALRGKIPFEELAMEAARLLAKQFLARIDLHTTSFAATFNKQGEVVVPAFRIQALRATGAGDAWNAGNILGDANALSDECRLALANAVAACYLASPRGVHPTRRKLAEFIRRQES